MFFVPTMVWELLARDSIGYVKKMLNNCAYSALIGEDGDLPNKVPEWVTKIKEQKTKDNKNNEQKEEKKENIPLLVDRIIIPNKFYTNMKNRYDNIVENVHHKNEKSAQLLIQSQMMSQQQHMSQPENLDLNEQQQQQQLRQQQHQSIGFFEANPEDQSSTDSNNRETRYPESKQQQQEQQHKHQFPSQTIHEITKEFIEPSKGIGHKK